MVASNLIWIPSLQDFVRFGEISSKEHRILAKTLENELEFINTLNRLIFEKCLDEIDLSSLTILDKYVICIYLRVYSIGQEITISADCPNCGNKFSKTVDINKFIESGISVLDKQYKETIKLGNFEITCGIPTIHREYDLLKTIEKQNIEKGSIDEAMTHNIISYIESIKIKNKCIELRDLKPEDQIKLFKSIPSNIFLKVKNEFISPICQTIRPSILNLECKTEGCESIEIELNMENINSLIRLLFQESPLSMLQELYFLSRYGKIDPFFLESLTPIEKKLIIDTHIKQNEKESSGKDNTPPPMNEFGFD